jgi:hypothetical protein
MPRHPNRYGSDTSRFQRPVRAEALQKARTGTFLRPINHNHLKVARGSNREGPAMTTEQQRQFIMTCLAGALFLGAVLTSVDVRFPAPPFGHAFSRAEIALR